MKTLTLSTGSFDQENTFNIVYTGIRGDRRTKKCALHRDYQKAGDGIYWAMSKGAVLKDKYSDSDRAEAARLMSCKYDIEHGEVVVIDGCLYRARVLGNFSDAAIFDPVI